MALIIPNTIEAKSDMERKLLSLLNKAIGILEKHGYHYAVIGGLAVTIWGRPRATYDIDIKVLVSDTDYSSARAAIRSAFPDRARPNVPENPLIVDTKAEGVIIDFLLTIPGYEENIINRARHYEINGMLFWICSPEDLVIQKTVAGRPQDWQDIEGILIEQYGHLDLVYLEGWLKEFVQALDRPEILSQYQDIQKRILTIEV